MNPETPRRRSPGIWVIVVLVALAVLLLAGLSIDRGSCAEIRLDSVVPSDSGRVTVRLSTRASFGAGVERIQFRDRKNPSRSGYLILPGNFPPMDRLRLFGARLLGRDWNSSSLELELKPEADPRDARLSIDAPEMKRLRLELGKRYVLRERETLFVHDFEAAGIRRTLCYRVIRKGDNSSPLPGDSFRNRPPPAAVVHDTIVKD